MPPNFDKESLADHLRCHPQLQANNDAQDGSSGVGDGNGVRIHTLALDLQYDQVATVYFDYLPTRLRTLELSDQLPIDIDTYLDSTCVNAKGMPTSSPTTRLTIDQHFKGITVLFSPPRGEYTINVLAVSGLGSHPFGSFVHKGDRHMWLSDSLPRHMPTARVMIYGYESGLQDSTSFAGLDDLASSLHLDICRLLRSGEQKQLVFIGHSLGGLLIKAALIRMAESGSEADLVMRIFGGLLRTRGRITAHEACGPLGLQNER